MVHSGNIHSVITVHNDVVHYALKRLDRSLLVCFEQDRRDCCSPISPFELIECGTERRVFRLATRDEFLISIIEVLREFLSDFRLPRRGKTQRNKSAENL
jgi:hypothetical protein